MDQVSVSTKYQVVIPKEIRRRNNIKVGQKMSCMSIKGIIYLVPVRPFKELRGFIKAPFSLEGLREKTDRVL